MASPMNELTKALVDIALTPQEFCICGQEKTSREHLRCARCQHEDYAERKSGERELRESVYGPEFD